MDKLLTPWKYTICFCIHKDSVLMMYRKNAPHQYFWNGLGGKIEFEETPRENVYREMLEEANINLKNAETVNFVGIVTWDDGINITPKHGMYAYIAKFSDKYTFWEEDRETEEGKLSWKPLGWISSIKNKKVVSNIPYFFPLMFYNDVPLEFRLIYNNSTFESMNIKPIPQNIIKKLSV